MDEAAEAGRALAARLRLAKSLNHAERTIRGALHGLRLHRISRFTPAGTARGLGPLTFGERDKTAHAAPTHNAVSAALRPGSSADHGQADTDLRHPASAAATTRAPVADPRGGGTNERGAAPVAMAAAAPRKDDPQHALGPTAAPAKRVKLRWHNAVSHLAADQQIRPASPAGPSNPKAGAITLGGSAGPQGDAAHGHHGQDARHARRHLPATAGWPMAGGGLDSVSRFQTAVQQALRAHGAPGVQAKTADAPQPQPRPASPKAMAPVGFSDRVSAVSPLRDGSPSPPARAAMPIGNEGAAAPAGPGEALPALTGAGAGQGPAQGDVYLDGTLVGRWMARSLAAHAGRPASGSAGFDPRRNVFPTGAMIGG